MGCCRVVSKALSLLIAVAAVLAGARTGWAACSITQGDFDGNGRLEVRVVGDLRYQSILVLDHGTSVDLGIDCDGNGGYSDPGDVVVNIPGPVEAYDIQGKGKDIIQYILDGPLSGGARAVSVTLGPATVAQPNRLLVGATSALTASNLTLDVLGSPGPDSVQLILLGDVTDSSIQLRGDLGPGDDTLLVQPLLGQNVAGSSFTMDVALGTGNNKAEYELLGFGSGSAQGSIYAANLEGSSSSANVDRVRVQLAPTFGVGTTAFTNVSLQAGADVFEAAVNAAYVQIPYGSALHVRARGGAGNDTLTWEADGNFPGAFVGGLFDVDFDGGLGNDLLSADVYGQRGDGVLRYKASGGDGNDALFTSMTADSSGSSPYFDVAALGGRGLDSLYTGLVDVSGNARYGPGGLQVDGGYDADVAVHFGGYPVFTHFCETGY